MNILFYSSVFPQPGDPTRGTFCANMCNRLASRQQLRIISPWPWYRRIRVSRQAVSNFLASPEMEGLWIDYPCNIYPPRLLRKLHGSCMWHSSSAAFRRVVEDFAPDCILSYWAYPDGAAALSAARSIGVPIGVIIGGTDVLGIDGHPARHRFLEVFQGVDLLMTVSQDLSDHLVSLGVDRGKIRTIYQGVDKDQFHVGDRDEARARLRLKTDGNLIVWVGRMVSVKGLDVLLNACTSLRTRGVEFRLCLIGDGPLRKTLEEQTRELGLAEVVDFVGPKRQAELPDWYRSSDMVVLPSHSEGIPNVLREALACGRPFVASRVGGIPELADPVCRLVPPNSVPDLAEAIKDVLLSRPEPRALSLRAPNPSWEEYAQEVLKSLERCVASRRNAPEGLRGSRVEAQFLPRSAHS